MNSIKTSPILNEWFENVQKSMTKVEKDQNQMILIKFYDEFHHF